jgi:hypothetical protein
MWTMGDYGGAGGSDGKKYFYLVIGGLGSHSLADEHISSFFRTGVNTGSEFVFVFIDIASDARLREDLRKITGNDLLFEDIAAKAPAFLATDNLIPELESAHGIHVYQIKDYENDIKVIYERMGINSLSTRRAAISFLRKVNRYLHLKPNIMGIGANLNDLISDLINALEAKQP